MSVRAADGLGKWSGCVGDGVGSVDVGSLFWMEDVARDDVWSLERVASDGQRVAM